MALDGEPVNIAAIMERMQQLEAETQATNQKLAAATQELELTTEKAVKAEQRAKAKYAEQLKIVNSLTRSVTTADGAMRQTSITFTDGQIWLAIFPLIGVDPIPPIKF